MQPESESSFNSFIDNLNKKILPVITLVYFNGYEIGFINYDNKIFTSTCIGFITYRREHYSKFEVILHNTGDKRIIIDYNDYTEDDKFQLSTLIDPNYIDGILLVNSAHNELLKIIKERTKYNETP